MPDRPPRPHSAALGLVVFAFTLALVIAPSEFAHYRVELSIPRDNALRAVALLSLLAKTLVALTPPTLLGALLLMRSSTRAGAIGGAAIGGAAIGFGGALGVAAFLLADLGVQARTGNGLLHFAGFLGGPELFQWTGSLDATGFLQERALRLGAAVLLAGAAGALVWRFGRAAAARRTIAGAAVLWATVLVAAPIAQQLAAPAVALPLLAEAAPWWWGGGGRWAAGDLRDAERGAEAIYLAHLERRAAIPQPPTPSSTPASTPSGTSVPCPGCARPDVVVILVESFRFDALTPEVMPHLWSLSERGARFALHHAGSNSTHYGLFALLYGRPPLGYFEALARGVRPPLPWIFRDLGYRTHLVSGSEVEWLGLEHFLAGPHFEEVHLELDGPSHGRDAATFDRATDLLAAGDAPKLLVAFLMSPHFGFDHPEGHEPFQPSVPRPSAVDPELEEQREALLNRYRNSAHWVDTLLGRWLEDIDLERTIVVVTGDHGEAIFDDGTLTHSSRLSPIQTRVPLVIAGPGVPPGRVVDQATSHVDLLATLLARTGAASDAPGRDLLESEIDATPETIALVHSERRPKFRQRIALVSRQHRYGLTLHEDRAQLRLLGHLDDRGLPSGRPFDEADGNRVAQGLQSLFQRVEQGIATETTR